MARTTYTAHHIVAFVDPWHTTHTTGYSGQATARSRSALRAIQRARKLAHARKRASYQAIVARDGEPAACCVLDDTSVSQDGIYHRCF